MPIEPFQNPQDLFTRFFDECPMGNVIATPEGAILRVNASIAAIVGYEIDELQNMSFLQIVHPDDLERVGAAVRALVAGEKPESTIEVRVTAKDGRTVLLRVKAGLVRDAEGKMLHLLAHVEDITARRQSDLDLRESEARYRRLFEAARDGILILDAETGRIVDVNPFMTDLTGYSREEFLQKFLWEIGPFKDTAASRESFEVLKLKEYVRYEDLPLKTRDGRTVDVEFVSNVYRVNQTKVIQCNIRDISRRKHVELDRQRLAAAIEQAAESVVITNAKGTIEYVNPAFERLSGYTRAEAIGQTSRILKSGEHDNAFYRALWRTIGSGDTWRGRMVNRKADGTLFTEDATISPVRDPGGAIVSYVAVKRDITATLAMEAQFLQAQKMEAVGRLAGGVAHDFNNLLSVILSYAHMLGQDLQPGDPMRADLGEIEAAGKRAAELTRQLLAFSRQQVMQPRVMDLSTTVAGMEGMLRRLLGADIVLGIVTGGGLWSMKADPGQIEQVVMNLAVNARDAMPDGGSLTLELGNRSVGWGDTRTDGSEPPGAYVELMVHDTGEGMTPATQAQIFEPFFTTKAPGKGTGLGLATVFGIVKQSGGHIRVDSEAGKGTTFRMHFPRVDVDPETIVKPVQGGQVGRRQETVDRGTETILVVEDQELVRNLATSILRRQGYTVLEGANAGEALLLCEQHDAQIDLLLTDVVLPRMSGRQLAERLTPLRPTMKVLYMSGYTDDMVLQKGIIESHVHFLQKPLTPAALCQKVREVLGAETLAA